MLCSLQEQKAEHEDAQVVFNETYIQITSAKVLMIVQRSITFRLYIFSLK